MLLSIASQAACRDCRTCILASVEKHQTGRSCATFSSMRWIKSPAWDLVLGLNPVWLAPLFLLLARGPYDGRASPVDALFFALTVPLWFGHRVSSAWLAYATPAYRPLLAPQRLRLVVAPLGLAPACFAVLLAPESALPMPVSERAVWLAVLNYLLV